eukprot:s253_g30.t1
MGACARSIFQNELARPCAKMFFCDLVHFCLRDADAKLISDLGFLASRILGLSACSMFSRRDAFLGPFYPCIAMAALVYDESTIILLPVSVGHSGQEPLCLREACASLTRNSLGDFRYCKKLSLLIAVDGKVNFRM